ncbi:hypothetical protein HMPREF0322_01350 [Desulfitobacterium hafniense DP7]|uniref:Uncharacterized protein n=1 Tax=Desulfitobacterium hafniense DP7 TaxID=537010 RepID=G9XK67_DESHA|nr:hypothetical protein HMPREF0322_01350 [Desulfitobacterium hafniense DP7]
MTIFPSAEAYSVLPQPDREKTSRHVKISTETFNSLFFMTILLPNNH